MNRGEYQNLVSEPRLGACLPGWSKEVSPVKRAGCPRDWSGQGLGWLQLPAQLSSQHIITGDLVTSPRVSDVSCPQYLGWVCVVTIIRDSWDKRSGGVALVVITFHNTHALSPVTRVSTTISSICLQKKTIYCSRRIKFSFLSTSDTYLKALCLAVFWWIAAEVVGIHWETRLTKIPFGKSLIYVLYWLVSTTVNLTSIFTDLSQV